MPVGLEQQLLQQQIGQLVIENCVLRAENTALKAALAAKDPPRVNSE